MTVLTILLYVAIATACGFVAERFTPGVIPGGIVTSAIVGILGAWVGSILFGTFGLQIAGVSLVPCILGSAILVCLLSLFSRAFKLRGTN